MFTFLTLVVSCFCCICFNHAKLLQVQIVHRHGARQVLDKHPTDPQLEGQTPTLYPQGVAQLKTLGEYCRAQYIEADAPLQIQGIDPDSLSEEDVISWTSNYKRTQLSARAFLSALYPNPDHHEQIPTLVFNGTETDWVIRGYALCPRLADSILAFVEQDELKKRKENDAAFVTRLAKNLGYEDEDVRFENVFNVYDEYNIVQNGYDPDKYKEVEKLSKDDMDQLKSIADWYESRKYSFSTHEVHVAGGLLSRIIDAAKVRSHRIVQYSAHYPTLLTLMGSIRSQNQGDVEFPADKIPEFGSALMFETHEESDGEIWLRLKWFSARNEADEAEAVAIGRSPCTDAAKGCKLSDVERLLALDKFPEEKFCTDCRSTGGVCEFSRTKESEGEREQVEVCAVGTKLTTGAIGGVIGLVVGLLLSFLYMVCMAKRKERASMYDTPSPQAFDGHVYA